MNQGDKDMLAEFIYNELYGVSHRRSQEAARNFKLGIDRVFSSPRLRQLIKMRLDEKWMVEPVSVVEWKRTSMIWVTFRKEGIHQYPGAKDLEGVEFLQYAHRHMFHFKISIEVFHDDRELEFILFKRELESLYEPVERNASGSLQLNNKSCEMIADELHKYIHEKYSHRDIIIEVSEDGENGATHSYVKI